LAGPAFQYVSMPIANRPAFVDKHRFLNRFLGKSIRFCRIWKQWNIMRFVKQEYIFPLIEMQHPRTKFLSSLWSIVAANETKVGTISCLLMCKASHDDDSRWTSSRVPSFLKLYVATLAPAGRPRQSRLPSSPHTFPLATPDCWSLRCWSLLCFSWCRYDWRLSSWSYRRHAMTRRDIEWKWDGMWTVKCSRVTTSKWKITIRSYY